MSARVRYSKPDPTGAEQAADTVRAMDISYRGPFTSLGCTLVSNADGPCSTPETSVGVSMAGREDGQLLLMVAGRKIAVDREDLRSIADVCTKAADTLV